MFLIFSPDDINVYSSRGEEFEGLGCGGWKL